MRNSARLAAALSFCLWPQLAGAQTFNQAFDAIKNRPEFAHANFGVEIYSLDAKKVLYAWNGDKLFVPGSTTKLLTEGTALELLGAGYRFHTLVYRTGGVHGGTLKGNLVLVASGDPNLSGRAGPDGMLRFANEDHSYGGFDSRLVGDPLAALNDMARQVAAAGIRKIDGQILIDASLFPEGEHEGGTGVAISPVIVNDNVVDVVISHGAAAGSPGAIRVSPQPSFMRFVNRVTTGAAGSKFTVKDSPKPLPHGVVEITLSGSFPLDKGEYVDSFAVDSPSRFAADLFTTALKNAGVEDAAKPFPDKPTGDAFEASYTPENRVAEFVSPPLSEDTRITLKVSQNLHAAVMPYIDGAVLGKAKTTDDDKSAVLKKGFQLEHDFLAKAGLDLTGAVQSDGPGGAAHFTPDFMVHYLAFMAGRPNFEKFRAGLPVLGKDGTLFNIQTASPAAGHVFAKTGTYSSADLLNHSLLVDGKGLAGYTTTPSGEHIAFALYVNNVPLQIDMDDSTKLTDALQKVGDALGEIATAANTLPIAPVQ